MNDPQIRIAFHRTLLQEYHRDPTALVIDELGLEHGRCRADIAVINGYLIGYEIKSDVDSLKRLSLQIEAYSAVFDNASVITTDRHLDEVVDNVPGWWGVLVAKEACSGVIHFEHVRYAHHNTGTNDYSVAQLLWRNEAQDILMKLGVRRSALRKSRALLYRDIIELLQPSDLRRVVAEYLKRRRGWRDHVSPFLDGGLSLPAETEKVVPA
jgi:hypothetical protein